jgi:hypothetical protein
MSECSTQSFKMNYLDHTVNSVIDLVYVLNRKVLIYWLIEIGKRIFDFLIPYKWFFLRWLYFCVFCGQFQHRRNKNRRIFRIITVGGSSSYIKLISAKYAICACKDVIVVNYANLWTKKFKHHSVCLTLKGLFTTKSLKPFKPLYC